MSLSLVRSDTTGTLFHTLTLTPYTYSRSPSHLCNTTDFKTFLYIHSLAVALIHATSPLNRIRIFYRRIKVISRARSRQYKCGKYFCFSSSPRSRMCLYAALFLRFLPLDFLCFHPHVSCISCIYILKLGPRDQKFSCVESMLKCWYRRRECKMSWRKFTTHIFRVIYII